MKMLLIEIVLTLNKMVIDVSHFMDVKVSYSQSISLFSQFSFHFLLLLNLHSKNDLMQGKDYFIDGQNTQLIFLIKCPSGGGRKALKLHPEG